MAPEVVLRKLEILHASIDEALGDFATVAAVLEPFAEESRTEDDKG